MKLGDILAGRYRLDALLGQGGMGSVYRGRDLALDRPVALKVPHEWAARSEDLVARFQREARTALSLVHPSLVRCLDSGVHEDRPFMVMELVEGVPLDEWFQARGRDFDALARLLRPLLEAVDHAHSQGIVHRDLKPENLLVDADDQPHVLDFGLARRLESDTRITRTGQVMGTVAYLSPEQASGERGDARSDLYALGAILYELASGGPVFSGDSAVEVIMGHLQQDPTPLGRAAPDSPPWLNRLVQDLLEKRPADRPASAREVLERLEQRAADSGPERSEGADRGVSGPVLGRRREQSLLQETLAPLRKGRGTVVRLCGPPGVGKTRLARDLETRARAQDLAAVHVAPPVGGDLHEGLLEAALAGRTGGAVQRVEAWIQREPMVLVLDGLERAEEEFRTVLDRLVALAAAGPLTLLVVARPEEVKGGLAQALESLPGPRIDLQGLDGEGVRALAERALGAALPDPAVEWLRQASGGNPLFLEALLRELGPAHLRIERGRVLWVAPPEARVPESLEPLLAARLEHLAPELRETAGAAACLGERFTFEELVDLLEGDEEELEARLETLGRARILEEAWEAGEDAFRFVHSLLWQAALTLVPPRRRRRFHLRAAESLQARPEADPERLARLFDAAGRAEEARDLFLAAGRAAMDAGDAGRARHLLGRARGLAEGSDDAEVQARILVGLAEVEVACSRFPEAEELMESALALAPPGSEPFLRARSLRAESLALRGRAPEALRALDELEAAAGPGTSRWLVVSRSTRLLLHFRGLWGTQEEALEEARRAWEEARAGGFQDLAAEAANRLAGLHQRAGDLPEARNWYEQALALVGRPDRETSILNDLGTLQAYMLEEDAGALHCFQRALSLARQRGLVRLEPMVQVNLGNLLAWRGEWQEAEAHLRECLSHMGPDLQAVVPYARNILGDMLRGQGRAGEAEAEYRAVLDASPPPIPRSDAFHGLGHLALEGGRADDALRHFEEAGTAAREGSYYHGEEDASLGRVQALLGLGRREEAAEVLASLPEARGTVDRGRRARLRVSLGSIDGEESGGLAELEDLARALDTLGRRPEAARCYEALACSLRDRGSPEEARLPAQRALELYLAVGLEPSAARVRAWVLS